MSRVRAAFLHTVHFCRRAADSRRKSVRLLLSCRTLLLPDGLVHLQVVAVDALRLKDPLEQALQMDGEAGVNEGIPPDGHQQVFFTELS